MSNATLALGGVSPALCPPDREKYALCCGSEMSSNSNKSGCNYSRMKVCAADRRGSGPRKRGRMTHLSVWLVSHISKKPVLDLLVEVRDLIKGAFG